MQKLFEQQSNALDGSSGAWAIWAIQVSVSQWQSPETQPLSPQPNLSLLQVLLTYMAQRQSCVCITGGWAKTTAHSNNLSWKDYRDSSRSTRVHTKLITNPLLMLHQGWHWAGICSMGVLLVSCANSAQIVGIKRINWSFAQTSSR